jgi:GntR family transcriptional regulator
MMKMKRKQESGKIPLYMRIKDALIDRIRSGGLQAGEKIPTEAELSAEFRVSRATVRQALTELVHEGVLVRKQGSGTFVNKPKIETQLRSLYSFSESIREMGLTPETRLIDLDVVLPKTYILDKLGLPQGELVYKLLRLRLVNGEPVMTETTYLPYARFPDLERALAEHRYALYECLSKAYHVHFDHGIDYFEPILIDEFHSRLLNTSKGSPALYIERIGYRDKTDKIELTQSVVRGDRCRYAVELAPRR